MAAKHVAAKCTALHFAAFMFVRRGHMSSLRRLSTAAAREWQMLPSGLVRWTPLKSGEPDAFQVKRGHVVRLKYVARLDDGSELSKGTLSFRLGNNSDGVCAAVDEACTGMRLGDSRRVRAAPGSRRSKALALAPTGEMLEYDLTLTGVVAQRTIMTIEDQASEGINPFNLLADLGKRSVAALYGPVAGLLKSREKPEPPKEP